MKRSFLLGLLHRLSPRFFQQFQELQQIRERYELLTENLVASVIIRDRNSKILYCSPYTEVLTGYPIVEIYQHPNDFFLDIVHREDLDAYQRALLVSLSGDPFQYRYRILHRSGMEMWSETRSMPLLDARGEVTSTLSVTFDVTGTALYQRQIEERNRDMQDFSYMLSHDLKAPLVTIKGMSRILREEFSEGLPQEGKEVLDHLEKASHRLEQLVNGVIEYSRLTTQNPKIEHCDLNQLIHDVVDEFVTALRSIQGTVRTSPSFSPIEGDFVRVYQIITNLIQNSLKYRNPTRPIEISIEETLTKNPRQVVLEISDNGQGIPPEKLPLIFRPFQRAHGEEIEGSGIGLATVNKLMEKLGGSIEASSTLGEGTTFRLVFRRG